MPIINSRIVSVPSQTPSLLQFDKASNNFPHTLVGNNVIPWRSGGNEGTKRTLRTLVKLSLPLSSASSSLTCGKWEAVIAPTPSQNSEEFVRSFYAGINSHDVASVQHLIAENCVYEDLMFVRPFVGRKAFLEAYKNFIHLVSMDLQIVIDDITSNEDSSTVGVLWHFDWKGKFFPYSRGCSFYRLQMVDGKRQIVYGRDVVEPSIKLGEAALVAIKGLTWLLQQFPQLEDQL